MSILDSAFSNMFVPSEQRAASSIFEGFGSFASFANVHTPSKMKVRNALKISAVYNAVDQISNDLAKIPFGVFQDVDGSKERLRSHPADWLISLEPNYLMTPFIFKKLIGMSLPLRGNCLFKKHNDNRGYVESLEYIAWDDVIDVKLIKGEVYYYIKGMKNPLMSFEVLHFKQFSLNGIVGISTITFAAMQLDSALKSQEFLAVNLDNKGVRQGVIETDKIVKEKAGIIQGWRNAMAEKSADRVAVLDDGFKFKAITITPQELQIIEQQKFSVEDIARWFNIAPHKIKSLAQSTNNNIEQQSLDHVSDTIQPIITNIEQEFTKKLLSTKEKENTYIKGNLNVLLRADVKSRGEFYSKMVNIGAMNRNEVRKLEDMNNGPDLLDEYLTPVNTFTESQLAMNLKTPK
ncbi:phage portal protein [Flavobacterium sp. SLB02]|uniref:phage portal protein n=1 Tax=Flavobacterium sp. SLB02 TaxID=2665645 RepID=UPI0012A83804|nr:phage portal protein [Flavobacterium sp. SLB02]QGK72839.1 phage portal protein [Flavobacterium sp. SLB02]